MEFLKWYAPVIATWLLLLMGPSQEHAYTVLIWIPIAYYLWRIIHDPDIDRQPMRFLAWWAAIWITIEPFKSLLNVFSASDIYKVQDELVGTVMLIPVIIYAWLIIRKAKRPAHD